MTAVCSKQNPLGARFFHFVLYSTPTKNRAWEFFPPHKGDALLDEPGPDEHLLRFFRSLAPSLKAELSLEIVRTVGKRCDWAFPELGAERLMLARYGILLRRRTILMTGLIDHYLAVKADREFADARWFGSLSPWRAARATWLELRGGELSPAKIADMKRYRGKRGDKAVQKPVPRSLDDLPAE
jgi:hypothetical protein